MRRIRLLIAGAVLGVAGIMAGIATPAVAATGPGSRAGELNAALSLPPGGTFSLANYNSDDCLGIASGEDNTGSIQWDCTGAVDQTWNLGQEDGTSGYYQLINGDGECLGVYDASTAAGADVVGWQCLGTGHPDQYWGWAQSAADPGYYYLVNYNSGQVLGVWNNSAAEGAQIVQWPDQNTPNNQLWKAVPASSLATALPSTPDWAGYSAHPASGYAADVEASWTVPRITCAAGSNARVAVWAGMWGGITSMEDNTAWLPQIGTSSQCVNGTPAYTLAWQMYSQTGGGTSPMNAYASGPYYDVYGSLPTNPAGVVLVNPGDSVNAEVYAQGPYGSSATERTFEIVLNDSTTGKSALGEITTNQPVLLGNVESQGGAIVESGESGGNGLAQFSPVTFSDVDVYGGSGGYSFFKWNMQYDSDQLASDGPLGIDFVSADETEYYGTVTWQHVT
jgi:hypothetical protein